MKRGTPDHPKTVRLRLALGCSQATVVGYLELLWHWTAKFAPRGDIGQWEDADIESAVGWDGEPGLLVRGLLAAGWVDEDKRHRLLIHDWADHADNTTKKFLSRKGLEPLQCPDKGKTPKGHVQTKSGHVRTSRDKSRNVKPAVAVAVAVAPCPLPIATTNKPPTDLVRPKPDGEAPGGPVPKTLLDGAREVFAYWQTATHHEASQWTASRRTLLESRLREEPGEIEAKVAGLKLAVDGAVRDPFFNGSETGRKYLDFDNIFRNRGRERIEKLQRLARAPERTRTESKADRIDQKVAESVRLARAPPALPPGRSE